MDFDFRKKKNVNAFVFYFFLEKIQKKTKNIKFILF